MKIISIRGAEREDCPRLLELVRGLAQYEKASHEVTISLREFEESGFGEGKIWDALVAETDGKIVGFALWYIRFSTWKGKRVYLEDIFVEPGYRGLGAGKMLFEALMEESRRLGISGMVWQALDWNEPALGFYRKYGARFDGQWINCSLDIPL
ncbi:MAG: GNAT family N-acetyltransferase [Rikenellaceae bacterium]|nr:GNAT family N-acetyltransferase [Rikenellaceae bacterium]